MDTKVLKNKFQVGDVVHAKFNKTWTGPMVVDHIYQTTDSIRVVHPKYGHGAFLSSHLELDPISRSPLWEALK